jgi:Zn-dependent peptidase ImmA (M78 family)
MTRDPALYAVALLERLKVSDAPDVLSIATALGVEIAEKDVTSFDGALVRVPNSPIGIIAVRSSIREGGRKRFTIAHELGHLLLPGHESSTVCGADRIENWAQDLPDKEVEANRFAGELLVPSAIALKMLGTPKPSFAAIEEIVRIFRTSLTASAYRFSDLTPHAVAIVWSSGGVIRWFKRSAEFTYWIRIRESLDERTLAHDLFRQRDVPVEGATVPASAWLDGRFVLDDNLVEQSKPIPSYDGVLTLLWIPAPLTVEVGDELLEELKPADFTVHRSRWPRKR